MPRASSRPESAAYIRRVLEYVADNPGRSTRQIAAVLGCDLRRVSAVLTEHARRGANRDHGAFSWYVRDTETHTIAPGDLPQFPPVGPSGDHATAPPVQLAEGLELKGQTIKVNGDGSLNHRYDKSHTARKSQPFEAVPDLFHVTKLTTRTDADGRPAGQYITSKPEEVERWNLMLRAAKEALEEFRGCAGVTPAPVVLIHDEASARANAEAGQRMNIFAFGDQHLGALADEDETGENNDLKIATRDTKMFLECMISIAPIAATAYMLSVGDIFHADDDKQATPGHGHKVDVDSRAHKIFRVGVSLWIDAVQRALATHERVIVDFRRGNHDPLTSFFLAETIRAAFSLDPRVEVLDNIREHNYFLFGKFLLCTTHGHRTKPENLEHLVLADVPALRLQATHVHWLTGHVHSRNAMDFRTCSWESLRTIFPGDAWAKGAAYRSFRGSLLLTAHKLDGIVMRQDVSLERARRHAGLV
jgi:hypothetical protein